MFGYILRPNFLRLIPRGCVNVHPALLPYNRGAYPNVWSIVDGSPAGVTIHFVDEGIDTGDIIAQAQVVIEPVDTGESLYRKLERGAVALFPKLGRGYALDRLSGSRSPRKSVRTIWSETLHRSTKSIWIGATGRAI